MWHLHSGHDRIIHCFHSGLDHYITFSSTKGQHDLLSNQRVVNLLEKDKHQDEWFMIGFFSLHKTQLPVRVNLEPGKITMRFPTVFIYGHLVQTENTESHNLFLMDPEIAQDYTHKHCHLCKKVFWISFPSFQVICKQQQQKKFLRSLANHFMPLKWNGKA